MVVGNHLFSFFDKKFREGVTRYESHPPSLRTVYFPTAPYDFYLFFASRNAPPARSRSEKTIEKIDAPIPGAPPCLTAVS